MLLRRHNLNLLPILRELLRTRSVARTSETIGLSQSGVSAALARLREVYEDEILVMVGRRLELTERGQQLVEQTERACLEVETLLRPQTFDPAIETRRFVVCAADYITYLLAPGVVRRMQIEAPNAACHFIDYNPDMGGQLLRGGIDVLAIPESAAGSFRTDANGFHLFADDIVVIASKRHKPFSGKLTRKAYEAAPHAMFQLAQKDTSSHERRILRAAGIKQTDVVMVEHFLTLPAIVETTECLALVQRRLAERFIRSHDIEIHPAPFESPQVRIAGYSMPATQRDAAHRWFSGLLNDVARELDAPA